MAIYDVLVGSKSRKLMDKPPSRTMSFPGRVQTCIVSPHTRLTISNKSVPHQQEWQTIPTLAQASKPTTLSVGKSRCSALRAMASRIYQIHVNFTTSLKCTTMRPTHTISSIAISTFQTLPDVLEQFEVSVPPYTAAQMDTTLHADLCRLARIGRRMIAETSTSIHL
jgi:hypothetical protein